MMKAPKNLFFRSTLIFLFFFSLFLSAHLLNSGFTSGDDPYYHAKHALLIEQSGQLNLVEPWLEFHFFNYAPVDPWWGFHLGMALFIHFFGLFLGVKIFVSLLGALVFLIFYLVLDQLKVKYPLIWTIFLFCSSTIFSYRLFLERPHLLSIIALPLAYLFLIREKNYWLFILSLFYYLCYDSAPLIILPVIIYSAVDFYISRRLNIKPLIATMSGLCFGIIAHPASLNFLYVTFLQLWQVFFLKFSGINLNVGSEAQTLEFSEFLNYNFLVLLFYILAVVIFLSLKKSRGNSVVRSFLFFCSSFWFLVTLLVPRLVEYWLPATFLFVAVIFNDFRVADDYKIIKDFLANKIHFKIVGFFITSILILFISYNLIGVFSTLYQGDGVLKSESYRQANIWLKANTKKDSVIFYDNWGMWPMMFFYNDYNHYIHGIDPTFFYEYDERAYWLWRNISSDGLYCDQQKPCFDIKPSEQIKLVPLAIKTVFRAQYVVASNYETSNLIKTLNNLRSEIKLVFKNKDLLIYEIK